MNHYFKNIRVISPEQNIDKVLNLWVKDGVIEFMGEGSANVEGHTKTIDATGLIASPGLFDMHVHLREPGETHKETIKTGATAAANGGFTGVCPMPNTNPAIDNIPLLEYVKMKAHGLLVDVYPSAALTKNRAGESLTSLIGLAEAGAIMFTDDGACVQNADLMRRAFQYAQSQDLLFSQHAQDYTLTKNFAMNEGRTSAVLGLNGYPSVAEEIILARDLMLAEYYGNIRYHASHISTKGSVELIREYKAKGMRVSAEVAPHHFVLDDTKLVSYDTNLKMNPPLRDLSDIQAIIEGLADGTIDAIATDHAPHDVREKECEFPIASNGIIGLETALGLALTHLIHNNKLSLAQLIEKFSCNPRRILQLEKIELKEGEKANITIFDPNAEWTVDSDKFRSKSRNTPFNKIELKGKPKFAINNNQIMESVL